MFDAFAARARGQFHHMFGNGQVASMVDANFCNYQWLFIGSYFSMSDLHGPLR
jgi:hypothetical protein